MRVILHALTATGPVRARNEDHVLLLDAVLDRGASAPSSEVAAAFRARHGAIWAAVSDGVGGAPTGHVASRVALESLRDRFIAGARDCRRGAEHAWLIEALRAANDRVIAAAETPPGERGMSATVSGFLVTDSGVHAFHGGDSRVYRATGGGLDQITRDHATPGMIARAAGMTLEEAVESGSAALNNCLGMAGFEPEVHTGTALAPGDRWLACTDGLFGLLPRTRIAALLCDAGAAPRLVDEAIAAGGHDNVSVALMEVEP